MCQSIICPYYWSSKNDICFFFLTEAYVNDSEKYKYLFKKINSHKVFTFLQIKLTQFTIQIFYV
ncbi:hypothetical protein MtrunA17_Chr7g0246201 [Medicago truncatula]|uniref:Uncharacterized protein n=1 Tax=Medicago truncatula TaxID=3880 RepID=A0A396H0C2_MEDTR|nr:hypothetical protein MtrunA17_Chr7g0246201 [Medicago truncatula]